MSRTDESPRLGFESFELDLQTGELSRDGHRIRLQDQPARLLALLATRPGELVTREEIQKEIWMVSSSSSTMRSTRPFARSEKRSTTIPSIRA